MKAREKKEISEKWTSHCTPFRKERAKASGGPESVDEYAQVSSTHVSHTTSRLHTTTQHQPHELALSRRIILDVASHGWVLAGHPRYTRAQFAEKAVGGSTTTRTRHDRVHSSHVKVDRLGPSWSTHRWRRQGFESCWRRHSGREAVAGMEAKERRKAAREDTLQHRVQKGGSKNLCAVGEEESEINEEAGDDEDELQA